MKFHVEPVSKKVQVPPHPTEGPMPAEGGAHWIADQYTLRLIVDGVIRRVEEKGGEPSAPASDSDSQQGRRRALHARTDAAPGAAAPQEA